MQGDMKDVGKGKKAEEKDLRKIYMQFYLKTIPFANILYFVDINKTFCH